MKNLTTQLHMKKDNLQQFLLLIFGLCCMLCMDAKAQNFEIYIDNDSMTSSTVYEFDVKVRSTTASSVNGRTFQLSLPINPSWYGAGTPSITILSYGGTGISGVATWDPAPKNTIKLTANGGVSCVTPTVIPANTNPPLTLYRIRVTNSLAFSCAPPDLKFNFGDGGVFRWKTLVSYWNGACASTDITTIGTYNNGPFVAGAAGVSGTSYRANNNGAILNTQPLSTAVCEGGNAAFNVNASLPSFPAGNTISYQWYDNGSATGTNSPTLNLTGVTAALNGHQYQCILSTTCGTNDTSSLVTLTVNPNPVVGLSGIPDSICANAASVPLTSQGSPGGGGYTIDAISAVAINPGSLSLGTHNLCYDYTDINGCSGQACKSFLVYTCCTLTATGSATDAACSGSNGTATGTPVSGTGPYQYLWSSGQSTQTMSMPTGTYTVTITDLGSGCSATTTATINEPTVLSATKTEGSIACFDGTTTVNITASGGTSPYSNDGPHTVSAGPYSFTVQDANGCTTVVSGTISQPTQLTATKTEGSITCFGGTTTVNITASGGTSPYTNDGPHTVSAGPYSFTIQDANGCTTVVTGTISEPSQLTASKTEGSIACFGGTTTVTITANGGTSPYTNDGPHTVSAGPYSFTVQDANGCTTVVSGTISEPALLTVVPSGTNAGCTGTGGVASSNPSGGTGGYAYLWSTAATTQNISGLSSGTYTVTVTDGNGCTASGTAVVTPNVPIVITGTITSVVCKGGNTGAIAITVTGGNPAYTYLWNNGSTTQNRTGLISGSYAVTVTDANGCTKKATFFISQPATKLVVNTNQTNVRCYGASTGIASVSPTGGTAPYTYSWNTIPVQTTAAISGLAVGSYTCIVTDAIGCSKAATVIITSPTELIVAQNQTNVSTNGGSDGSAQVIVSGGIAPYTYVWNTVPSQTTASITGLTAGTYKCTVKDHKGCTKKVTFIITHPPARFGDSDKEWNFTVTPNPSAGMVYIHYPMTQYAVLEMTMEDVAGRTVYRNKLESVPGENEVLFDFSQLPKGVYFIKVINNSSFRITRIVLH